MSDVLFDMLKRYKCNSQQEYKNALKEIVQEMALLGLWRAKFFEKAAFYGGTCLRIFYGLDRFSEDLDFSLLEPDEAFDLDEYQHVIETELSRFGMNVKFTQKQKNQDSAIMSAFLKANTLEHLIKIDIPAEERKRCHVEEQIKIKLEVDTNPPPAFSTTVQYQLQPIPYSVRLFSEPDLFAGKMHAILCRSWKNRVKGRDWYDLIWFVKEGIPLNLGHLEARMRQSGHFEGANRLKEGTMREFLTTTIEKLDLNQAKMDILPFVKDSQMLELWSPEFFHAVAKKIEVVTDSYS